MTSIFNIFNKSDKPPKRQLKQQELLSAIKSSLIKSCRVCKAQPSQKVVYGDDVEPGLTCKRCQLKAVNNDPPKLISNLILTDKFSQSLAKEVKVYNTQKTNPNNSIRTHTLLSSEGIKTTEAQITEIKQAYKQLQGKTQEKLTQLIGIAVSCNEVPVFEKVGKLVAGKKLEQVEGGKMLVEGVVVTDGLHFLNAAEIEGDNRKNEKRVEKVVESSKVEVESVEELVKHIDGLLV